MKKIVLQKGKEKSLQRFHPWVFSGAIHKSDHFLNEGEIVEVLDYNGNYIATGHYHNNSIAVRVFSFQQVEPDLAFWKMKIGNAISYRKLLGFFDNLQTNMFRLINGEGDDLPGLIVDWFDGVVVIQFHSVGMYLLKDIIVSVLQDLLEGKLKAIYNKSATTLPDIKGVSVEDEVLFGNFDEVIVKENGNSFYIDILKGQKTGFFIDQRENRALVGEYAKGKKVLNLFCYTGGFSIYALANGAKEVHSVDISKKATDILRANTALIPDVEKKHEIFTDNVFDYLENIPADYYDLIVLDPPAFAKHHKVKEQGIKGYRNINRKAMEKIKKGGLLFTFSCSQAISKDDFQTLLFSSAVMEGKSVKVMKQLQQAVDHPVNIYHPEGNYLKGFMLHIS
ncbi:class I SAM-dependent rRNA methyltransferase [Bacteroidales bacterium OttesenSCG-928-C03]|nr:class I SAM-dependent rRNA methyltransferase [Bacteroidales bacterium OttesenSCG-928-C03]